MPALSFRITRRWKELRKLLQGLPRWESRRQMYVRELSKNYAIELSHLQLKDATQLKYEIIRPVVLWGQTPKERGVLCQALLPALNHPFAAN